MLEFTVIGSPATKGSVTSFVPKRKDGSFVTKPDGTPMVVKHDDTGSKGKAWSGSVATAAHAAMVEAGVKLQRDVPLMIEVDFYQPRPKAHFGSGRNAHLLRADAPPAPAKRPDVDKLLRAILDALSEVVYADDGQIAAVTARKFFGEPARAVVRVAAFVPVESDVGQMALAA